MPWNNFEEIVRCGSSMWEIDHIVTNLSTSEAYVADARFATKGCR